MKTNGKYVALRIRTSRPIIKGEKVRNRKGVEFTYAGVNERGEVQVKEGTTIRPGDLVDVMVREAR